MGHDDVASGYPISTGFRRLTGCQRDPRDRGVTPALLDPGSSSCVACVKSSSPVNGLNGYLLICQSAISPPSFPVSLPSLVPSPLEPS